MTFPCLDNVFPNHMTFHDHMNPVLHVTIFSLKENPNQTFLFGHVAKNVVENRNKKIPDVLYMYIFLGYLLCNHLYILSNVVPPLRLFGSLRTGQMKDLCLSVKVVVTMQLCRCTGLRGSE